VERVVLTGYRGSGKTTVGRALAAALSLPFIDTDSLVEERAGRSIPAIFAAEGEEGFRVREKSVIAHLPDEPAVIATGGGTVLDPANVRLLRKNSVLIYLQASAAVIEARTRGSDRPALTGLVLREEIESLLRFRAPAYERAADYCVDTGEAAAAEVATTIRLLLFTGTGGTEGRRTALSFLAGTGLSAAEIAPFQVPESGVGQTLPRACAVIGNPCSHSRSPMLFNHLFSRLGLNYHYTRIEWNDPGAILHHARMLGMKGLSVTIPFKSAVMPYLDTISEDARAIGAVNTVVQCGGRMHGSNTDWIGIMRPLDPVAESLADAVVLGAGGAAAAAVYALQKLDVPVTVLNRNRDRARALARRFACAAGGLDDIERLRPDLVINATSVGMNGQGGSLLESDQLRAGMVVFDLVYTPPETELLREARRAGCTCIHGTEMFVHQACAQFLAFTGIEVDTADIREVIG
jgi:shikimate dehydrogenase